MTTSCREILMLEKTRQTIHDTTAATQHMHYRKFFPKSVLEVVMILKGFASRSIKLQGKRIRDPRTTMCPEFQMTLTSLSFSITQLVYSSLKKEKSLRRISILFFIFYEQINHLTISQWPKWSTF